MKKINYSFLLIVMFLSASCSTQATEPTQPVAQEPVEMASEIEESVPEEIEEAQPPSQEQDTSSESANVESGSATYNAPHDLFTVDIPASWQFSSDASLIEDVTVETFSAPDGNAFVQVVVDEVGSNMDHVVKGQVTLDYMRQLYDADLRVATDVTLADGQEKLEWWSDMANISGTTYFDTKDRYLYMLTVYTKDGFEEDYQPLLDDVIFSFSIS